MSELILKQVDKMSHEELWKEWSTMAGKKVPNAAPRWILALGLQYHLIMQDKWKKGLRVSDTMIRRFKMAKELDIAAIKKESDFLTPKYKEAQKEIDVKKKGKVKESKKSGLTASEILIKILGKDIVPSDASIIEEVKGETGSVKFDGKQLAWYKWKYRQGKLKGQDGKLHIIAQTVPKKETKAKKLIKK